MTTNTRAGRPPPVDLMFGGDEAEELFESWLADDRDAGPPVRVQPSPRPETVVDDEPGPAACRMPPPRSPARRLR